MNEDELRAFLESATDEEKKETAKDPAPNHMSFEELMGIKRSGSSAGETSVPEDASDDPSAPERSTATARPEETPTPEVPRAPQSEPELSPIVLPGPPQAQHPSTAPFWEQNDPSPEAAPPPSEPFPATAPLPVENSDAQSELFGSDPLPAAETGEYEKISVVGSEKTHSRYMPWVIVGVGAVLAIIASLVVVFAVRGGEEPAPTVAPTTQTPAEPTTTEPTDEPTTEPTEQPESPGDEAPEVEVGNTGDFEIASWGMKGEISAKFGWPRYTISGDVLTFEGGTLLPQFPESCAAMRTGFGITKMADGSFEVHRPAETCAEAPDFYNEVWGLTAAIIPTLEPA